MGSCPAPFLGAEAPVTESCRAGYGPSPAPQVPSHQGDILRRQRYLKIRNILGYCLIFHLARAKDETYNFVRTYECKTVFVHGLSPFEAFDHTLNKDA